MSATAIIAIASGGVVLLAVGFYLGCYFVAGGLRTRREVHRGPF